MKHITQGSLKAFLVFRGNASAASGRESMVRSSLTVESEELMIFPSSSIESFICDLLLLPAFSPPGTPYVLIDDDVAPGPNATCTEAAS